MADFNYSARNWENLEADNKERNLWIWYKIYFWSNMSWLQQEGIRILILMINAHKLHKGYDVHGLSRLWAGS